MAVNDLTFNQLSTVLNSIVQQATGQQAQKVTNTAEFVSVAQTGAGKPDTIRFCEQFPRCFPEQFFPFVLIPESLAA